MEKRHKDALTWLENRLKRKYKIPVTQTEAVLGAVADLAWDWKGSKYDLYGLQLEDILHALGAKRAPIDRKDDVM